ncbi:sporulation-specific protein 22 [Microsporum canis]
MAEGVDDWTCVFVSSLRADLTSILNETSDEATRLPPTTDLDEYISQPFPLNLTLLTQEDRKLLDDTGVEVWNACNLEFVKPERINKAENLRDMCKVIVIAFLLLECAIEDGVQSPDYIRLFDVGLKSAGRVIEMGHPDLAIKVFERLAGHDARISQIGSEEVKELAAKCSFQHSILLWKDPTEQLSKPSANPIPLSIQENPQWRAKAVHILCWIGIAKKNRCDSSAIEWLQRCYDIISMAEQDGFSEASKALRQSVLHELIRAKLELQKLTAEDSECIRNLLNDLQEDYGSEPSTWYLAFEVFHALGPYIVNGSVLCDNQLQSLIDKVEIESNFNSILHCIHKFWHWEPVLAYRIFQRLITEKIKYIKSDPSLLEKAILIYLRLCTFDSNSAEGLSQASMLLMLLYLDGPRTVEHGPDASHAARVIFLSKANICYGAKDFTFAFEWCKLTQHPAFMGLMKEDEAIIRRKIMFYALHLDNAVPLDFIDELAESNESFIYSHFMVYQYALKHDNLGLVRGTPLDFSIVYACIAYAESCEKTSMLCITFGELLDEYQKTMREAPLLK